MWSKVTFSPREHSVIAPAIDTKGRFAESLQRKARSPPTWAADPVHVGGLRVVVGAVSTASYGRTEIPNALLTENKRGLDLRRRHKKGADGIARASIL